MRLDADRQVGLDARERRLDVVAERQHVAAVAHGDGQPDRRLAVDAEHRLRRVGKAAAHARDVAHADHPPAGDEVDVQDVLLGPEGARDPQRDALVPGLDDAGGADIVLGADRGQERLAIDAQARQLLHRELDEDHLVLGAQDVDLGHVGDVQELGANLLDIIAQLAVGEAVGGEAVDDPEHVAEAVVEERPDRPGGQRVPDVVDVVAHPLPSDRHLGRRHAAEEVDEDRGAPGQSVAAQHVQPRDLLQLALEPLGHLQGGLVQRRPRPAGRHHHGADGEGGVLVAAELDEREHAGDHGEEHQVGHDGAVAQRPTRQIEAGHERAARSRTFWPGCRA